MRSPFEKARLPRSIATVSLSRGLRGKLQAAAAAGFDAVEIFENDLLAFDGSPSVVRRIAEDLGIVIALYQPFRDFEAMPEPYRSRNFDRAERKFDVMQALGTDLLLVCSNTQSVAVNDDEQAAIDLAELGMRAAARSLRVGYEALAWGYHVTRWGHAWRIVSRAGHPALGLILDSFHVLAGDDSLTAIADIPGERLFFVHLADAPRLTMDPLSLSRHFRSFPGQGQLPISEFLRAVHTTGYSGPLSLEIFNDNLRTAPAQLTARDGLRSLIFSEAGAGALTLPELPHFDGFAFVEIAVDETCSRALSEFLKALGFRHAGRHCSKTIQLYRKGEASLILNAEPSSYAAEHFRLHGASVCAIGLRVDDPSRAAARACALGCQEWAGPDNAVVQHSSAIRAPDGMLIKLIGADPGDRNAVFDGIVLFQSSIEERDNTQIDHISQALPRGSMDCFVLFYRSVLGLQPQALLQLSDPFGLIRSCAMVSREGSIRLALNASETDKTTTGKFVGVSAGAGVHHIALLTDDIVATLGEFAAQSVPMLAIPGNYYDDLGARHALDEHRLAEFASLNVLYDHDDTGEFLHAYTETFDHRFFFEIVQRRNYSGFGAVNAPIRMAAQTAARERGFCASPKWPGHSSPLAARG